MNGTWKNYEGDQKPEIVMLHTGKQQFRATEVGTITSNYFHVLINLHVAICFFAFCNFIYDFSNI